MIWKETLLKPTQMMNNGMSGSRYHYGRTPWMKVKKRAPWKSVDWQKQDEGLRLFSTFGVKGE